MNLISQVLVIFAMPANKVQINGHQIFPQAIRLPGQMYGMLPVFRALNPGSACRRTL